MLVDDFSIKPLKRNDDCERCPLHESSQTVCCKTIGPRDPAIMLVGEALGANEEREGRPFVGDAGRKLSYLLGRAGLTRKEVAIGNSIRCRPPGNKQPTTKHLSACWPYLLYDILVRKPKVIVALGGTASALLIGESRGEKLKAIRGFPVKRTFSYVAGSKVYSHTCWVVPTMHPAACLRDWALDDLVAWDLQLAKDYSQDRITLSWPDTKVKVADTEAKALALLDMLEAAGTFVLDLETSGLDPHSSEILCASFCVKAGEGHVLPLRGRDGQLFWRQTFWEKLIARFKRVLLKARLVGQNLKFDVKHLRKLLGVVDFAIKFDTYVAHRVLDENKPANLDFLCQQLLGWDRYSLIMKPHASKRGYLHAPTAILWKYAAYDADGTFRVWKIIERRIEADQVEEPRVISTSMINALADMEYRGIRVSRERITDLSQVYRKEAAKLLRYVQRTARRVLAEDYDRVSSGKSKQKKEFNPLSHQQLSVLMRRLDGRGKKQMLRKRTAGGGICTDKNVLGLLAQKQKTTIGRVAKAVTRLRLLQAKYIGQYLDGKDGDGGLVAWILYGDRIHTSYNFAARTGRLSSDDPPMQTHPRTGELRTVFIPDSPRHVFLAADYEKLELCIMAYLASDPVMCRELLARIDLHTRMALTKQLGRDPTDEEFDRLRSTVGKEERAVAKAVNFGIPYGLSEYGLVEKNPDAFDAAMSRDDRIARAAEMMAAHKKKYEACDEYFEDLVARLHASKTGHLRTWRFNRRRRLEGIKWFSHPLSFDCLKYSLDLGHLEREARNFEIQSVGSDILSLATPRCWRGCLDSGIPGFRVVMTLHDALVFCVRREYVLEAAALIVKWMETTLPADELHRFEMPVKVEVNKQDFWGEEYLKPERADEIRRWYQQRGVLVTTDGVTLQRPSYARKMKRVVIPSPDYVRKMKRVAYEQQAL